jgi:cobalt-zinc-cadmium efflux system outer membrane protein
VVVASLAEAEPLAMSDALKLALIQSPVLSAHTWELRAADGAIQQANLRPNPELALEVENVRWTPGPEEQTRSVTLNGSSSAAPAVAWGRKTTTGARSGFSDSELTLSIAQPIELGRKRARRVAMAEHEKVLVTWDYHTARANVLAKTASDFIDVLAHQERVALHEELVGLAEEVVRVFQLRVDAGSVSPLELSRADIALATVKLSYQDSVDELEAARAVLASNWASKRAAFSQAVGLLEDLSPVPTLQHLEEELTHNPDLARWSAELAMREASLALARAKGVPDITLELGLRASGLGDGHANQLGIDSTGGFQAMRSSSSFDSGHDERLVLGFSMPLPLFDRNQGNIAAAGAMIGMAGDLRRGAEATAQAELTAAHHSASEAFAKAQTLRKQVMPKINNTFEKIQIGYREGKFGYLEVLDTQKTLFEARDSYLNALVQYHQGVVRIERLTGRALDENLENAIDMEQANHDQ